MNIFIDEFIEWRLIEYLLCARYCYNAEITSVEKKHTKFLLSNILYSSEIKKQNIYILSVVVSAMEKEQRCVGG